MIRLVHLKKEKQMSYKNTKLGEWCELKGISSYELGRRCNVTQSCAFRWMVGETRPDWGHIPLITQATEGAITANDFVPQAAHVEAE